MNYITLAIAIVAEVCATTAMKQSDGFTRLPWAAVTVVGYGVAFYFLSLTLKTICTGIAYAIWSGVGIVLISAFAWAFQGQKLDPAAMIGMGLIVAGVVVMNVFSNASAHCSGSSRLPPFPAIPAEIARVAAVDRILVVRRPRERTAAFRFGAIQAERPTLGR